jgi:hypothetical protein
MRRVTFVLLLVGFFAFLSFGIDTDWKNWHLHKRVVWNIESCIFYLLSFGCAFGAWILSKNIRPRRNRYIARHE